MRRQILAEKPSEAEVAKLAQFRQLITSRFDKFFTMGNPPGLRARPGEERRGDRARAPARRPDEVAYDYILEDGQYLYFPVVNYTTGDHEPIREMLNDPACLLGLSDGGAHCTSIIDAGVPSYMLTHWGRDRTRGPRLPLEMLVKRQTSETADFFGLSDRGRLAPGLRADVNLIDFDAAAPAEARARSTTCRRTAGASCSASRAMRRRWSPGTPIFERGEHTGALPGKLVRAGRISEASAAA